MVASARSFSRKSPESSLLWPETAGLYESSPCPSFSLKLATSPRQIWSCAHFSGSLVKTASQKGEDDSEVARAGELEYMISPMPTTAETNNRLVIAGVMSWGYNCFICKKSPILLTNFDNFNVSTQTDVGILRVLLESS